MRRVDAKDKVCGLTVFPSDRWMYEMLWVEAVRSPLPHARIKSIDTREAEAVDGVARVLTADQVPGKNAFGIQIQDMPVLCRDRVRYVGDAVALVGADSRQQALLAASLVRVEFEELELLCDPQQAMQPGAMALHPNGNILHQGHFQKGELEKGFQQSATVIEQEYQVQMVDHAFLETEAGISYYDHEGLLTVESCGQYVYRDRVQIARVLGLPLDRIRVVALPVGGAFGGKDEITVQIHLALMTYRTKRPAKMVLTRPDSMLSHAKRHPVKMWYKTGAAKSGKLTALQARFVSDTGAYASLGSAVLDVMLEHAAGPYLIPHVKIDGYAVYTNNGFSGAFRGFGCTQAALAMESQMDLMAKALEIDPLRFRLDNVLHKGDLAALGCRMETKVGAEATLRAARKGKLYRERRRLKKDRSKHNLLKAPYIQRGVGVACTMKGIGLGAGVADHSEVRLDLNALGQLTVRTSTTEMGQGCHSVYIKMIAERFGLPMDRIGLTGSDTFNTPDSGPTSASRSTYAVGNALLSAADGLESALGKLALGKLGRVDGRVKLCGDRLQVGQRSVALTDLLGPEGLSASSTFHMPEAEVKLAAGMPHKLFGFATHVILVEVDTLSGQVSVEAVETYMDAGQVAFRKGFEGQSEGGVGQGIGYALLEEVLLKKGRFQTTNFDSYVLPSSLDVPVAIRTVAVGVPKTSAPRGAIGMGELATVGVAPAILNAIHDAIGVRFTRLPVRPEHVLQVLEASNS